MQLVAGLLGCRCSITPPLGIGFSSLILAGAQGGHCQDPLILAPLSAGHGNSTPSSRWGLGITPGVTADLAIPTGHMVDLSSVKHTKLGTGIMDERDALCRAQFDYYGQLLYRF